MGKVMVHSYMVYRCEKCGKEFRMWCEKGIEDGEKTSPFVITHTCGGFAKDISGLFRINKPRKNPMIDYDAGYMVLPEGESYFANKNGSNCGIAIFVEGKSDER